MGTSKSKANSPTNAEHSMPESLPQSKANAADFSSTPQAKKEMKSSTETVQLPTKSWRALLEEPAILNKDAKPFEPGAIAVPVEVAPSPQPNRVSAAPPPVKLASVAADKDDPEWMQYLSKKAESKQNATPDAGSRPGGKASDDVPAGNVVIHTESYLQLLKEGSGKKNKTNANTARRKPVETRAAGGAEQTQAKLPMPIMTSSLVQKWSSVVSKRPTLGESKTEEDGEGPTPTVQDDTWIAKLGADHDLSDPAYHSEDEEASTESTVASVHRLGRRPRVKKCLIRSYVMQDLNFLLDQVVGMMLLRLQRFTDQQMKFDTPHSDKTVSQVQQPRRFVIGLKEVMRRTKQSKIKCLIVAPDIEEDGNSGGLDDRMRDLLASAYQNQTPVVFALSRARLGKALGKHLHISVLGILDARGAQGLLDEAVEMASGCQQTWLARLGN